jgi:hypothetical protein
VAEDWSKTRLDLNVFGVTRTDLGWLYLMRHGDLFKVGRTKNPSGRIRDAKTWLPNVEVVAIKPFWNVSELERLLHEGLANYWHDGEWFSFSDAEDAEFLIEGFKEFYEKDRDANSVDFIYWYNGSGMAEFNIERANRRTSLRKFQRSFRGE